MKWNRLQIALLGLSLGLMACLSFFVPREDIYLLWFLMGGLFFLYGIQLWMDKNWENGPNFYLLSGGLLRLAPLFSMPLLSDDYFRFVWDGRLLAAGVNPFLKTPREFLADPERMQELGLGQELLEGMNSPDFFTIYPPVLQGIFVFASYLSPGSTYGAVVIMKLFIFAGEMGSILLIGKLLRAWKLPLYWLGFYTWNPLVIIELVGNVHFEGLMIFFLLLMIYLIQRKKTWLSIIPFGLAICTKLLPLMLAPLLIRRLGWGRAIVYGMGTGLFSLLLFLTIFDQETFAHMLESVELYFANFEFNASIWYLIREGFGHLTKENLLEMVGRYLGLATFIGIMLLASLEKRPNDSKLPTSMLWAFAIYFLFSPVVHPWYICTLVALAGLGRFRFPILWSALLPLTYMTYNRQPYEENLWLVLLEYLLVFGFVLYEIWNAARQKSGAF